MWKYCVGTMKYFWNCFLEMVRTRYWFLYTSIEPLALRCHWTLPPVTLFGNLFLALLSPMPILCFWFLDPFVITNGLFSFYRPHKLLRYLLVLLIWYTKTGFISIDGMAEKRSWNFCYSANWNIAFKMIQFICLGLKGPYFYISVFRLLRMDGFCFFHTGSRTLFLSRYSSGKFSAANGTNKHRSRSSFSRPVRRQYNSIILFCLRSWHYIQSFTSSAIS